VDWQSDGTCDEIITLAKSLGQLGTSGSTPEVVEARRALKALEDRLLPCLNDNMTSDAADQWINVCLFGEKPADMDEGDVSELDTFTFVHGLYIFYDSLSTELSAGQQRQYGNIFTELRERMDVVSASIELRQTGESHPASTQICMWADLCKAEKAIVVRNAAATLPNSSNISSCLLAFRKANINIDIDINIHNININITININININIGIYRGLRGLGRI